MLFRSRFLALTAGLLLAGAAQASYNLTYEVTITNITRGQTFTPQLVTTHSSRVALFELGQPASDALEVLAEDGGTGPLTDVLLGAGYDVADVQTNGALLPPGESVTITVRAGRFQRLLSFAAMMIPTNDTFVAVNSLRLPFWGSRSTFAKGYDAGTEPNDQNCANMPGPRCGGVGLSEAPEEGDEGYVYISNGFHDIGSEDAFGNEILGPLVYDWRNPVARVTVKRVR